MRQMNVLKQAAKWAVLLGLILVLPLVATSLLAAVPRTEQNVIYVVVPHPDDEFQTWSLVENKPHEYKVFISLTRGEATSFCDLGNFEAALQSELGEASPDPLPEGKRSDSCELARADALVKFLTQMSQTDPSIPGDFGVKTTYEAQYEGNTEPCSPFGEEKSIVNRCGGRAREVWVWLDKEDRGAVLMFNLGDGDLLEEEVEWAVRATLEEGEKWGLNVFDDSPALISAFSNFDSQRCFTYPHEDHLAVEQALWDIDYDVGPQVGATCFADPRRSLTAVVSAESVRAAFEVDNEGVRVGAHGVHYGWLHSDVYPLASWRQSSLFHRVQSFWVRYG